MKRLWVGFLILGSFSSHPAEPPKTKASQAEKEFTETIVLESMKSRSEKKYNLNVSTAVALEGGTIRSGEISYNIDELRSLTFSFSDIQSLYSNTDDLNASGKLLSVNYKRFFGNSFYIKSGIYYKNQKTQIAKDELRDHPERTEKLEALGLDLRIGNQWQWDHFTVGIDWIGQATDFYNLSINRGQRKETNSFLYGLNLYIGAVF